MSINDGWTEEKTSSYLYLDSQDPCMIRLLFWIDMLEDFRDRVDEVGTHAELCMNIRTIIDKLTMEVGQRLSLIYP